MLKKVTKREMWSSRWIIITKPDQEEYKMIKKNDKSAWIIGGTTLIGIGVGFFFLKQSVLFFVASILIGIGLGLVISSFFSKT